MISALSTISALLACVATCIIEQPSITLGSRSTLEGQTQTDVLLGKVLATSTCQTEPTLLLSSAMGEKLAIVPFDSEEYEDGKYKRVAYFYKIEHMELDRSYEWSVKADNLLGPFQIKLSDKSDFHQFSYILVSNLDASDGANSVHKSLSELNWTRYDAFIHNGNFAFDVQDRDGLNGDLFFKSFAQICSQVPTLVVPGHRDSHDNYRMLNFRFRMPGSQPSGWSNNLYHVVQGANIFIMLNGQAFVLAPTETKRLMIDHIRQLLTARPFIWKIIVLSSSFYCQPFEAECSSNTYELAPLISLFVSCKVSLVLSSQKDAYHRYAPMDDSFGITDLGQHFHSIERLSDARGIRQVVYGASGNKYRITSNLSSPLPRHIRYSNLSIEESFLRLTIKTYYLSLELIDSSDMSVKDTLELSVSSAFQQSYPSYLFYTLLASPSIVVFLAMLYEARRRKLPAERSDIMRITNRYWDEVDLTLAEDSSK